MNDEPNPSVTQSTDASPARVKRELKIVALVLVASVPLAGFLYYQRRGDSAEATKWLHQHFEDVRKDPAKLAKATDGADPEKLEAYRAAAASRDEAWPSTVEMDSEEENDVLYCINGKLRGSAEQPIGVILSRRRGENGPEFVLVSASVQRGCHCHQDVVGRCVLD